MYATTIKNGAHCGNLGMAKEVIRDFSGKIIAFVEDDPNRKSVRSFDGRLIGWYDKRTGITYEFNGRIVAKGDATGMLIGR